MILEERKLHFINILSNKFNNKIALVGEYYNNITKTQFKCEECGTIFYTTPKQIMKAIVGCPTCAKKSSAKSQMMGLKEFVSRSKLVHSDKYDYSKVDYINNRTKVIIICPEHGEFFQTPKDHLSGQGCPSCAGVKKLTTEEFISRAKLVHGDKYDYSKTEYVNNKTKVCIIHKDCNKSFMQKPNDHLSGCGCPYCFSDELKTAEQFIVDAKSIHGDKYDYSKVEYKGNKIPVVIICKECGNEFLQKPNNHLSGQGCPECNKFKSKGEERIQDFLVKNDIKFIHDKACLEFLGRMRPDFYLPDYNIVIEYDGEQHFRKPHNDYFCNGRTLEEIKQADKEKNKLCEQNKIEVLRIPYTDFKNIETILEEKLCLQKK